MQLKISDESLLIVIMYTLTLNENIDSNIRLGLFCPLKEQQRTTQLQMLL
jgi:hypothetical protein